MRTALYCGLAVLFYICALRHAVATCGYESCPKGKDGYLNIHLVPHSHDDVGWLKTVDEYYYGAKNSIQQAGVQYILDSVISELQKSPDRRFIYVETGFFWRWWTNQDSRTQSIVQGLVQSGQLEFINGGWCMNDEATTHYNEIIDQMSLGLRFLNDTFGSCGLPRVAWQIDPFGHSREQASIFAQMGFDGLFFGRLDYQDKFNREIGGSMETLWSGSPNNLGQSSWLFTGALFNGYNPPDGYCFDILCGDDPIMDDPKLLGYNLDRKVEDFLKIAQQWAKPYRTNNVLMTMGSDFQYQAAPVWYKNLDKLIRHVNARQSKGSRVNLLYSTPSCYLQDVHTADLSWPLKKDDFFPYASDPHAFWTGYFTSRPALKYYVHQTNNFLQACKQLGTGTRPDGGTLEKIRRLAEPLAVAQHHDAVAGTAKQNVSFDYALRLSLGIRACEEVIDSKLRSLTLERHGLRQPSGSIQFCHQLNVSSCGASEAWTNFLVNVYNPLGREVRGAYVRVPVPASLWEVYGPQGSIPAQVIPIPAEVFLIPGRSSSAQYEVVFPIESLPPLSLSSFELTRVTYAKAQRTAPTKSSRAQGQDGLNKPADLKFTNSKGLSLELDRVTGLIKSVGRINGDTGEGVEVPLSQNFYYYRGMAGKNERFEDRASGAYIFRPNGTQPEPVALRATYTIYRGEHVTEIRQTFTDWISQVIRLYEDSDSIEFEWLVGPIPIGDEIGKEVITRYKSDLKTDGAFFTDANGRELLRRKRNFRPTWPYKVYEPVAGNYYPVNSRLILSESESLGPDSGNTLILLNDRAQGGTSMNDGELELMIHRRLLYDDAFGVGEALNEEAYGSGLVVRGKHWLVLAGGKTGTPVSIHRPLAQAIFRSPILTFSNPFSYSTVTNEVESAELESLGPVSLLPTLALPPNINLLSYERLTGVPGSSQHLIRLEHFYENGEDESLSSPVTLPVQVLRDAFGFQQIRETTLGGNQWKDETRRFNWKAKAEEELSGPELTPQIVNFLPGNETIVIGPMEIKTFILFY